MFLLVILEIVLLINSFNAGFGDNPDYSTTTFYLIMFVGIQITITNIIIEDHIKDIKKKLGL